jgi:hypothetical protein
MIEIKWLIEERELPGIGLVCSGKIYKVKKAMADSLVKQGHASFVKKIKKEV